MPWPDVVLLEVIPSSLASAHATLEADEANLYLTYGDEIDCSTMERHPIDSEAIRWAIERLTEIGERGTELWKDRRRHLFGGQNVSRVAGKPFIDVESKHVARLTLVEARESWRAVTLNQVPDPVADESNGESLFLVDNRTSPELQTAALAVRREFGSAVSVLTRYHELGKGGILEVIPRDRDATRMRLRQDRDGAIETSTGDNQYFEYEFTRIPSEDATEWILEVGRHGLLETKRTGFLRIYWFSNGPADAKSLARAQTDPEVSIERIWHSWAAATSD